MRFLLWWHSTATQTVSPYRFLFASTKGRYLQTVQQFFVLLLFSINRVIYSKVTFKKVEFRQSKIMISKCAFSYAFFARTNENRDLFMHAVSWDSHTDSKTTAPAFCKTSLFKCHVSCSLLGDYSEQVIVQNHGAYTKLTSLMCIFELNLQSSGLRWFYKYGWLNVITISNWIFIETSFLINMTLAIWRASCVKWEYEL